MKKFMKLRLQHLVAAGIASFVIAFAAAVAAAPCLVFYHQPVTPENMKSRLANR